MNAAKDLCNTEELRDLALQFESLGGGGHGCEFGLFQRELGAEPLGLLRWADLGPDQLALALETQFAGVGKAEYTTVFAGDKANNSEWWTTDTRYHMAMRTFIETQRMTYEQVCYLVLKRLQFLSRKLIDDLSAGNKIFVYRHMYRNLRECEIIRLYSAVKSYGSGRLFYIRYQDEGHPNGTVEQVDDNLLVGYIDHFSWSPKDEFVGPPNKSLISLCKAATRAR